MPRIVQKQSRPAYQRTTRYPRRYVRGSGAYTLDNGPWAKRGAYAGQVIGSRFGGPIGGFIGSALGRRLFHYPAKLFGSGAYTKRRRPVIRGHGEYEVERMAPEVPTFAKKGDYVEISFREYIGDIISAPVTGETRIYRYAITLVSPLLSLGCRALYSLLSSSISLRAVCSSFSHVPLML